MNVLKLFPHLWASPRKSLSNLKERDSDIDSKGGPLTAAKPSGRTQRLIWHGAPRPTSGPTSRLRNRHSSDLRRRPHNDRRRDPRHSGGNRPALLRRRLTPDSARVRKKGPFSPWGFGPFWRTRDPATRISCNERGPHPGSRHRRRRTDR